MNSYAINRTSQWCNNMGVILPVILYCITWITMGIYVPRVSQPSVRIYIRQVSVSIFIFHLVFYELSILFYVFFDLSFVFFKKFLKLRIRKGFLVCLRQIRILRVNLASYLICIIIINILLCPVFSNRKVIRISSKEKHKNYWND